MRYIVATVDEVPPGGRKVVTVGGRSIGVFNVGGEWFALRNRCPHQGGPLCVGEAVGLVESSAPGSYTYSRPGEFIRCPWHGWEFDVRTGGSWFDPRRVRVRAYDVAVAPGAALAPATSTDSGSGGASPPAEPLPTGSERVAGPYTAETYPVSIDRDYVVVDIPGGG